MNTPSFTVYEFFAGGGMARLGLGRRWECAFANDFDPQKAQVYRDNFGADDLYQGDVWDLAPDALPGRADLAWASSPCQDLSLAGARAGLAGGRSSAFWGFWRLMEGLHAEGRAPRIVVIENVCGLLTSSGGRDFTALAAALAGLGYCYGALEVDARHWIPQSRPRLFVIATVASAAQATEPREPFHSRAVVSAFDRLPEDLKRRWVWWRLGPPARRNLDLAAVLEPDDAVDWLDLASTRRLLDLMSPLQRERLEALRAQGERRVGALFRRVRTEDARRVQRAEARFDGLAGCLRTPRGGSSRQYVVVAEGGQVRARLISPREAARLMGLPESYRLPPGQTAALKVLGDGVAVPVVRALARDLLEPLLEGRATEAA